MCPVSGKSPSQSCWSWSLPAENSPRRSAAPGLCSPSPLLAEFLGQCSSMAMQCAAGPALTTGRSGASSALPTRGVRRGRAGPWPCCAPSRALAPRPSHHRTPFRARAGTQPLGPHSRPSTKTACRCFWGGRVIGSGSFNLSNTRVLGPAHSQVPHDSGQCTDMLSPRAPAPWGCQLPSSELSFKPPMI